MHAKHSSFKQADKALFQFNQVVHQD